MREMVSNEKKESLNNKGFANSKAIVAIVLIVIAIIGILLLVFFGKKVQYDVTFDSNGGSAVESITVDKNGLIVKPEDPTKENYAFAGWYYNDELYDFSKPVTGDIELEARWVEYANVSGVKVDKTELTLTVGQKSKVSATVTPDNAKDKTLTWSSNKPEIVSVDANGNVTALKAGNAVITVTTKDGGYKAEIKVTVNKQTVKATGVSLNKTSLNLKVNESNTLTATIKPNDATNKGVTWSSSNPEVATVDANGKVTGKKAGAATITVTTKDGSYTATCSVKVSTVSVTGVSLNKSSLELYAGESNTLRATVTPSDATNKGVTWSSSNSNVATVDSNGKVTAKNVGTTTITVTTKDGNYTATCTVTVMEKPANYVVVIEPIELDFIGGNLQYSVKVQKNGAAFSDYDFIIFEGQRIGKTISETQYNKQPSTVQIMLSSADGTKVNAAVVYK